MNGCCFAMMQYDLQLKNSHNRKVVRERYADKFSDKSRFDEFHRKFCHSI